MSTSPASSSLGDHVREELSCSICLELFTRPKVLPCMHTFCHDCLQDHAGAKAPFLCPNCRLQVDLSPLGVAGLPDNHLAASLCERIGSQVRMCKGARRQSQLSDRCKVHPLEELRVFCKECEVPVCDLCLERSHDGHPTTTLRRASLEMSPSVETLIMEGRNLLETYCNFLRDLRDTESTLKEQKHQTDSRISYVYNQMVQKLTEAKQGLLSQVDQRHRGNIETIQGQRETILAKLAELSAACDSAELGVKEEGIDVFHYETNLGQAMDVRIPAPNTVQTYDVAVFEPTHSSVPKLGHVVVQSLGSVSIAAACGRAAQTPTLQRQAAIFSPPETSEPTVEPAVIRSVSIPIPAAPSYTEVKGQGHSQGQRLTFGGKGSKVGEFDVPCGVAVSEDGEIFVADCANLRVQVFTLAGVFARQFATVLSDGRAIQPDDVAMDTADCLWVVGVAFAAQYTKRGALLSAIELPNTGWDRGIAMDTTTNNILVSQTKIDKRLITGEIQVLRKDGETVRTVGGQHGMKNPAYVAVDNKRNILVSDNVSHYVYVYNQSGYLLSKFGGEGSGEGQLKCPSGICTDAAGNIIVADTRNSRVELFDKTGSWVRHVATAMRGPLAVAVAPDGQLVVTDSSDNTVTIFHSY